MRVPSSSGSPAATSRRRLASRNDQAPRVPHAPDQRPLHHDHRPGSGAPSGRDLGEAQRAVQRARGPHRRQRVEAHATVAHAPRALERIQGECASASRAACGGHYVEPLQLAHVAREWPPGHAARRAPALAREKEAAARRGVGARQRGELLFDAREAVSGLERARVVQHERARIGQVARVRGRRNARRQRPRPAAPAAHRPFSSST
jgi:hypothetical protein